MNSENANQDQKRDFKALMECKMVL